MALDTPCCDCRGRRVRPRLFAAETSEDVLMMWFLAGFVVGGVCGVFAVALMAVSKREHMGPRF